MKHIRPSLAPHTRAIELYGEGKHDAALYMVEVAIKTERMYKNPIPKEYLELASKLCNILQSKDMEEGYRLLSENTDTSIANWR